MKISVVIPAYNESKDITATIKKILSELNANPAVEKIQIIVVDDHSSDDTYGEVVRLKDARVVCLRLSKNSGSHVAYRAGIKEGDGDAVLCIAADGQDDISCFKNMLEKLNNGANTVWALRINRKDEPWHVRMPAKLFYKLLFLISDTRNKRIAEYISA